MVTCCSYSLEIHTDLTEPAMPLLVQQIAVWLHCVLGAAQNQRFTDYMIQIALSECDFCNTDPELEKQVRKHIYEEEQNNPEAAYAEIIHLPNGRTGNIASRPHLREYEIVYLARSGSSPTRQLPITDLLVSVDSSDQIILYSESLKKRVIPRLTSAHAYDQRSYDPVYRFLCYMQHEPHQNVPLFDWGPLEALPFLPRVRAGRVILSPSRWVIKSEEMRPISRERDRYNCFTAVQEIRNRLNMPRWIVLSEGDQDLPVDLDNFLSVDSCVHILKRRKEAIFREMIEDDKCIAGSDGSFRHEIILPFVRRPNRFQDTNGHAASILGSACSSIHTGVRNAPPGGEWLYAKLYGGISRLDEILLEVIYPLISESLANGLISRWFFIRYAEPHHHLRIRVQGTPSRLLHEFLPALTEKFESLLKTHTSWKVEVDTYDREIERYGGVEGVALSEDLFYKDSETVIQLIKTLAETRPRLRWIVAMRGVDAMWSDFGLDMPRRKIAALSLANMLTKRLKTHENINKGISDTLRASRNEITALFGDREAGDPTISRVRQLLEIRSSETKNIVARLHNLKDKGLLCKAPDQLVHSYVHMHINRMLQNPFDLDEQILYQCLSKILEGQITRIAMQKNHTSHCLVMPGAKLE